MTSSPHRQSDPATHTCARDAIACLDQGAQLLLTLSDEQYVCTLPPMFVSGLGAHVRHIIDHVDGLLSGLEDGRIDYDNRRREERAERDRRYAIAQLEQRMLDLAGIPEDHADFTVAVNMDTGCGSVRWARSSLTRELQFVISHTIHHYALMAAILVHSGLPVPPDFGISPSTVRHRNALKGA